jgi:hypothetical protein
VHFIVIVLYPRQFLFTVLYSLFFSAFPGAATFAAAAQVCV